MQTLTRTLNLIAVLLLCTALAGGGLLFYRMVDHMERMTRLMGSISESVAGMAHEMGEMGREVKAMGGEMRAMRESMARMEGDIARLGGAVDQGAREMEKVNPMQMMDGFVPRRQ